MASKVIKLYFNPKLTGAFTGLSNYAAQRKINKNVAKNELEKLKEYYLYKPARKTFERRPIVVHFPNFQIAFDLMDKQKYAKENKGYKYILIVIDSFSKFAYMEALKSKLADAVIKAFKKIFRRMKALPKYATADAGKEWMNKKFFQFIQESNITFF